MKVEEIEPATGEQYNRRPERAYRDGDTLFMVFEKKKDRATNWRHIRTVVYDELSEVDRSKMLEDLSGKHQSPGNEYVLLFQ